MLTMPLYAILCTIDPVRLERLGRLRADHYAFLVRERHRIRFGGPARGAEDGAPETMIMIVEAKDQEDAEAFIAVEPYNMHGAFSRIVVRPWTQVLPEAHDGDLQRTLEAERAKAG